MRIAIFGAGAVGGYFGARLAEAGRDVFFIARGAHLRAIAEDGLKLRSPLGDVVVKPAQAAADPRAVGPVDVVLVSVKGWQLPEAAGELSPLIGQQTMVVPLQNGVEAPEVLAAAVGPEPVVGGLCRIFARVDGPGRVVHRAYMPSIEFGELDGRRSERIASLAGAFEGTVGLRASVPEDIMAAMWVKLVFMASVSSVGALSRVPIGEILAAAETRSLLESAMKEVETVGRARGAAVPDGSAGRVLEAVQEMPPEEMTSMMRDVLDGRRTELETLGGAVVRLGEEAGVPTPVHAILRALLLPQEMRARSS